MTYSEANRRIPFAKREFRYAWQFRNCYDRLGKDSKETCRNLIENLRECYAIVDQFLVKELTVRK